MGTPSVRLRLVFKDPSILTKTQRSEGMYQTWLLLKPLQHPTISHLSTYLLRIFNLHRSCPNGIILYMEGFALPPFESTEILKENEIICVKKKGGSTVDGCNLLDNVLGQGDDSLLLLGSDDFNKGTKEYQSESEEVDEEQSEEGELREEAISKKRKASTELRMVKKKKQCLAALDDDEDEAETEDADNINNDASHPKKISSTKEANKFAATSNKKVKSSTVKRSEEHQENVEEANQVSNASGALKGPSRNARRKKARRECMRELAKIGKKKPQQAYANPEITKPENKEANDQPKGLLYWKQASKKPLQNGNVATDVGPVATRHGHVRFQSLDEDHAAKQTGTSTEKVKWNGSSTKKTGQKWGRENLSTFGRNDQSKRLNKEPFKTLYKDSKEPAIDPNDFDKLPPCSEPKEGDVIAYRLLELNSSWIPEFSSFRVGRISYYDAEDIVLIPVTEYPITLEKDNEDKPNDSLYREDGTLEINYSALVDVRTVQQYDPDSNKAESSKQGQNGNAIDPWLNANKRDPSQENNPGWSNALAPTSNNCENTSSWGRPWSAFVVSKGSSVIQPNKENKWHAGSSRGNWKPTSRGGAPRGRGRGRGRGQNGN